MQRRLPSWSRVGAAGRAVPTATECAAVWGLPIAWIARQALGASVENMRLGRCGPWRPHMHAKGSWGSQLDCNRQRMTIRARDNSQARKLMWARKPGVYFERELSRIARDSDDNPQPSFLDRARTRRPRAICHRHASIVTCSRRLVVQGMFNVYPGGPGAVQLL